MEDDPAAANRAATPLQRALKARASRAQEKLIDTVLEDLTGIEARWLGEVKPFFRDLVLKAQDEALTDAEFITTLEQAARRMPELFDKLNASALEESLFAAMSAATINGAARGHLQRRIPHSALRDPQ